MQSISMYSSDEEQALAAGAAVLVVECGGQRYAFDMKVVIEIACMNAVQNGVAGRAHGVLHRRGVRVPVFDLDQPPQSGAGGKTGGVVVLDLPDRITAIAVNAVCEVRMAQPRSYVAPAESDGSLRSSVAWVAVWDGGEAPVLDAAAWLRARELQLAQSCVS